jgi:hypothetical protein
VSADEAGYEIRASRSKISRMEHGRVGFKLRDVSDLLTLYGVSDQDLREQLTGLARRASTASWWAEYRDVLPGWFESYLGLEAAASLIRSFEVQFVHGLFQTEDYARAVIALGHRAASAAELDRRVHLRMQRQSLLTAQPPPRVWSVMDEAVLQRPVGGTPVMRAQLARLREIAGLPNVTLQVVPFGRGGHAGAGGAFTLLRFREPDLPDVVYIEQLTGALYLDRRDEVEQYLEVMNTLAAQALTPIGTERYLAELARAR